MLNQEDWQLIIFWALFILLGSFGLYCTISAHQRQRNWTKQDHIDYLMRRRSE